MIIKKPIKAIFIDLDGTLADSAPDLTTAINMSLKQLGLPGHTLKKIRHWIGNGLDQTLHRALTDDFHGTASANLHTDAKQGFITAYEQVNGVESTLFPGVKDALERFSANGIALACVTNKGRKFTMQLLEALDIQDYFSLVVAGDDVNAKKPAPDALNKAITHYDLQPGDCLMIGDSDNDVYAGNRAGVDVLVVDYGYSQGVNLADLDIAGMISSINDIEFWEQ